ncbi:hypothetical protein [Frankia nepalensis]|uniref:hypothetical protein n=1 Tax=Frankia nepalensis TaxID=1836974 RepID=UPI001EE4E33E|nr:hypothetical protein [Frankia nepalensis]
MISKAARIILTLGTSVLATIFLGGGVIASPASAATTPTITQHYNGKLLPWDKETWNGATSCAVVSATDVYCFDTQAEAEAFTAEQAQAAPASTLGYDCTDWTHLYGNNHHLQFRDWGYWQNLNQWVTIPLYVESWSNRFNTCKSYFRYAGGACQYIAPGAGPITFNPSRPADQVFLQKPSNPPAPGC